MDMRKIDYDKQGNPVKHGTLTAYKFAYCRCIGCVDNYRRYHRDLHRRLKRERGGSMLIQWEDYGHLITKHIERGVLPVRIAEASGIGAYTILRMVNNHCSIRPATLERLKTLPDELAVGRVSLADKLKAGYPKHPKKLGRTIDVSDPRKVAIERRRRFQAIFKYFWAGGFTRETLAERLGTTEENLERFIDSDYEDSRLCMRICQLHHVMRQGE